jgi:hypothetical protein
MRTFEELILRSLLLPESRQIYEREVLRRPIPDLFHYTSQEGLVGILQSKKIWASECRSLKDTSELTHAEKVIRETLAAETPKVRPEFRQGVGAFELLVGEVAARQQIFVTSFCERGDRLEQWRGYAPSGYCIRFHGLSLENLPNWLLGRVVYDLERQREIVRATLAVHLTRLDEAYEAGDEHLVNRLCANLGAQLSLYAPCFKNPSFDVEYEWRGTTGLAPGTRKIRVSNGRRIPYVEIELTNAPQHSLPIVEVLHAPVNDQRKAKRELEQILRQFGYSTSLAKSSIIPLRI